MRKILKKFLPPPLFSCYHWALAWFGALLYRFPSRQLIVIGVTGTNGKSTTTNFIAKILEEGGYSVGLSSTFNFKIGPREWLNDTKMTMQGRLGLQKLLRLMVDAGCQYAVIETSSEGIKQYRHLKIIYDVAVFTNLTPEHIEAHGSFERYREAKGKLFQLLRKGKILRGMRIKKVSVVNLDDPYASYFLAFPADEKWGVTTTQRGTRSGERRVEAKNMECRPNGIRFDVRETTFHLKLLGKFNVLNASVAIAVGLSQNIPIAMIQKALEKIPGIPGRMEFIEEGQPFTVIIDYAHEPAGLETVYQTIRDLPHDKIISVLGSQGGGRDIRKRPILGKLASQYTDFVIVTNEDPYDDDPQAIVNDVARGALSESGRKLEENVFKILDRREAIRHAFSLAKEKDIVIITGKGAEQNMVIKSNKKIPWDDREVTRNLLKPLADHSGPLDDFSHLL